MILEQELRELGWQFWVWLCSPLSFSLGFATHSKLYSTVQLPGASLALIEVLLTDYKNWLQTNKQTENRKQTDSGVYRVAPATINLNIDE